MDKREQIIVLCAHGTSEQHPDLHLPVLNEVGRLDAGVLRDKLLPMCGQDYPLVAIYSSPQFAAVMTAMELSIQIGQPINTSSCLNDRYTDWNQTNYAGIDPGNYLQFQSQLGIANFQVSHKHQQKVELSINIPETNPLICHRVRCLIDYINIQDRRRLSIDKSSFLEEIPKVIIFFTHQAVVEAVADEYRVRLEGSNIKYIKLKALFDIQDKSPQPQTEITGFSKVSIGMTINKDDLERQLHKVTESWRKDKRMNAELKQELMKVNQAVVKFTQILIEQQAKLKAYEERDAFEASNPRNEPNARDALARHSQERVASGRQADDNIVRQEEFKGHQSVSGDNAQIPDINLPLYPYKIERTYAQGDQVYLEVVQLDPNVTEPFWVYCIETQTYSNRVYEFVSEKYCYSGISEFGLEGGKSFSFVLVSHKENTYCSEHFIYESSPSPQPSSNRASVGRQLDQEQPADKPDQAVQEYLNIQLVQHDVHITLYIITVENISQYVLSGFLYCHELNKHMSEQFDLQPAETYSHTVELTDVEMEAVNDNITLSAYTTDSQLIQAKSFDLS